MPPTLNSLLGRRSGADVVGLDIQPGVVAAVKVRVNGGIVVERAAVRPLAADAVREGEVVDRAILAETLRELFADSGLGKRVRVGVANQRTVMRTLELPPMDDHKQLAQAVSFQAQDQVPMPLANAVLDHRSLGVVETPQGLRERVVLVAAQRDMIEALLDAVRSAGLQPEGVDLSAFALIRSLYRPAATEAGRVLYLNVDGLTNLAIADGPVCSFTRVVGGGLEGMATELAERRGIPVSSARELIGGFDLQARDESVPDVASRPLGAPVEVQPPEQQAPPAATEHVDLEAQSGTPDGEEPVHDELAGAEFADAAKDMPDAEGGEQPAPVSAEEHATHEALASYTELVDVGEIAHEEGPSRAQHGSDEDVRLVIENGIREIAGEVRNSLDFHRSQEPAGEVSHVSLSGAALGVNGFPEALSSALDIEVRAETVALSDKTLDTGAAHRLAVAAGLATLEAPR
jgi:type IV pilus assembly protein PilM